MKNTYSIITVILFAFAIINNCNAQVPFPDLIINNQTFSTGTHNYYNSTSIISPDDPSKPVIVTNNATVEYKAGNSIVLKPGFSVSALNNGSFHAFIEPSDLDLVIIEPVSNPGYVGQYEKFEAGLKLPQNITDNINKYIYHDNASGLNPFDPDQISVEATFTSATNRVKTIYGFYYKEFSRDIPNFKWDTIHTDYPWRIRFAPDEFGTWTMVVNVTVNYGGSFSYTSNAYNVICQDSDNKGYLEKGTSGRYLRYSGTHESFFAIGEDIADAVYTCWTPTVPSSYLEYQNDMTELASVGGNYVRHFMVDAHPVEWKGLSTNEILTNFNFGAADNLTPPNKGEINAWELDQFFGLAKNLGLYINLTLDNAGDYSDTYWTNGNPYSSINSSPLAFFQNNNNSWSYYKKRLRYIVARWGYSTNLACYELFNEIDQLNPYTTDAAFQEAVAMWQNGMAGYLKSIDNIHLVTTSYAGSPAPLDYSYNSPHIDITSIHSYERQSDEGANAYIKDINRHRYNALGGDYPSFWQLYSKPYIIGESGMSGDGIFAHEKAAYCCNVSFHNTIWASAFMGSFGAALNWNTGPLHSYFPETFVSPCSDWAFHNPYPGVLTNYYQQIKGLSSFMQNINFENDIYTPQNNLSTNPGHNYEHLECFTLTNSDGSKAYGWMHQRSYYWLNLGNIFSCLTEFGANTEGQGTVDAEEQLFVTDLQWDTRYLISLWRCPYDGSPTSFYSVTDPEYTNLWGSLKKGFGLDFQAGYTDFAYSIVKYNSKIAEENNVIYDTLNCPVDTIFVSGSYKNDITGSYSYHWDFGNGQTSNEWHPKIYYSQPGDYLVTLIVNDTNGLIDTLKQWEHVMNCDSLFADTSGTKTTNIQYTGISDNKVYSTFVKVIPNPNNGNMQVSYEIPENTIGTFEVYDLIGEKLFSYSLFSGKNNFSISRSDLNQGIYFYRAIAGNKQIAADKIVIIK